MVGILAFLYSLVSLIDNIRVLETVLRLGDYRGLHCGSDKGFDFGTRDMMVLDCWW